MKTDNRIIWWGIAVAILFYLAASLAGSLLSAGTGFVDSVMLKVPGAEVFTRLAAVMAIVIVSVVCSLRIQTGTDRDQKSALRTGRAASSVSSNPALLSAILNQFKLQMIAIAGFADLLNSTDLDETARSLYSKYIYHNSKPLLLLLENLTDLYAIETGQITLKHEECPVNGIFGEVFSDFTQRRIPDLQDKDPPELLRSGHKEELVIFSDNRRLKQVLSNLLTNSYQFSRLPGIEIGYSVKSKFLEFQITDNVQSLRVDHLDVIFENYNKNTSIRNQSLIVAAIRLRIAQGIVSAFGGQIWTKTTPGEPSATCFTIPFEEVVKPVEIEEEPDMKAETPVWDQYNMLITEDIKTNYIYLAELLKPTKINITWAKNGREAVEMVRKSTGFDVILMDVLMPEMDGFEAAALIRKTDKKVPIVVQTAYSLENEPAETISNFDDFLTKPIWSNDLIRTLSKHLGRKSAQ